MLLKSNQERYCVKQEKILKHDKCPGHFTSKQFIYLTGANILHNNLLKLSIVYKASLY